MSLPVAQPGRRAPRPRPPEPPPPAMSTQCCPRMTRGLWVSHSDCAQGAVRGCRGLGPVLSTCTGTRQLAPGHPRRPRGAEGTWARREQLGLCPSPGHRDSSGPLRSATQGGVGPLLPRPRTFLPGEGNRGGWERAPHPDPGQRPGLCRGPLPLTRALGRSALCGPSSCHACLCPAVQVGT